MKKTQKCLRITEKGNLNDIPKPLKNKFSRWTKSNHVFERTYLGANGNKK